MNNKTEIEKKYNEIFLAYKNKLEKHGVKMPKLYANDRYTLNALVLVYLYSKIGKVVSKQELTDYLRTMGIEMNDVQQARHLAQQGGWYILSGTRGDSECSDFGIKAGEYMLKTIEEPYPSFKNLKRTESLNANSWEELKEMYQNRCVTCGSEEGKPNYLYPASITALQQGHKDPTKPLTVENTIPQCQFCNRASRNYFVFDNKGRVEKINNPHFVLRSDKDVQKEMLQLLMEENMEEAKRIMEEFDKGD